MIGQKSSIENHFSGFSQGFVLLQHISSAKEGRKLISCLHFREPSASGVPEFRIKCKIKYMNTAFHGTSGDVDLCPETLVRMVIIQRNRKLSHGKEKD